MSAASPEEKHWKGIMIVGLSLFSAGPKKYLTSACVSHNQLHASTDPEYWILMEPLLVLESFSLLDHNQPQEYCLD